MSVCPTYKFDGLYAELEKDRPHWANEEEVRKSWLKHLENSLDIKFNVERQRNDASRNQVIIEFKDKGLFNGSVTSAVFKEAVFDRLEKYIRGRSKAEGIPAEDYIGIAIDGEHICFAFYKEGAITHRNLLPCNLASVSLVAQACLGSKRRAVTAECALSSAGLAGTTPPSTGAPPESAGTSISSSHPAPTPTPPPQTDASTPRRTNCLPSLGHSTRTTVAESRSATSPPPVSDAGPARVWDTSSISASVICPRAVSHPSP